MAAEQDAVSFGQKLDWLKSICKVTDGEIGAAVGASDSLVCRWRKDERVLDRRKDLRTLERLARLLLEQALCCGQGSVLAGALGLDEAGIQAESHSCRLALAAFLYDGQAIRGGAASADAAQVRTTGPEGSPQNPQQSPPQACYFGFQGLLAAIQQLEQHMRGKAAKITAYLSLEHSRILCDPQAGRLWEGLWRLGGGSPVRLVFDKWDTFYYMMLVVLGGSISNYRKGIGIQGISSTTLDNIPFPLAPIAEQARIVSKIEEFLPYITQYDATEQKLTALNTTFPAGLKKSILQYAIQGKLVEQDPADEPASVLIERIREERQRLIKEGKIKRDKRGESVIFRRDNSHYEKLGETERCIDDEIPFDLPDSWEWARLGTLCNYGECENAESCDIDPAAWLLDLEDIEKDSGRLVQRKQKREVNSVSTKHRFSIGQVLYSKLRPYLNKVIVADESGYCTSEILPLDFGETVYNRYAQTFLMSPYFVEYATQCSYGVKMPRLGTQDGRNALVALPPLAEQHRIAKRVEALLEICRRII